MRNKYRLITVALAAAIGAQALPASAASDNPDPSPLLAPSDPNKERRDWMHKGNAEYVQKNWEAARDAYRKSWDIKHHYTIAANLADVEMKMGHYAEAAAYLKYVLANLPESKPAERKFAEEQLLECRNHLTVLRVATDVTDATVLVDGRDVGQTPLREDVLLEPGKHVISVTKPGYGEATKELSAEGSRVEVTLTLEKESTAAPAQAQAQAQAEPDPSAPEPTKTKGSGHSAYRVGSYVGFGLGAVGIGLGTLFVIQAHGRQSDSDSQYASCYPHCSPPQKSSIEDLDQSAQQLRAAGTVSYVVGGLGLATGVTFLVLDSKHANTQRATIRPWLGIGRAGVTGQF